MVMKIMTKTCSGNIGASRPAASSKSFISLATSLVVDIMMVMVMMMMMMVVMMMMVMSR